VKEEGVRVLIVEDDPSARAMIRQTIELMDGYVPIGEVSDGLDAIHMTRTLQPDVILMDIKIPTLSGLEASRRISDLCPTPIVVISAFETSDLIQEATEAGVGAYLIKPISSKDMERAMAVAMARHEDLMRLRRLNHDLKARMEDVDTFANAVAHDLQNPLALLIGFAEALRKYRDSMTEEDLEISLQNIEQSGWRISQIMDQLVLLARARKLEADLTALDTAAIVSQAQKRLADVIEQHEAEIISTDSWPKAQGHSPWVEEVWVACLQHAIRHSDQKPPTLLLGGETLPEGMTQFEIRVNGAGTAFGDDQILFEPLPLHRKGHGLGMSVARRIVDTLGGELKVEDVGGDTLYIFTLPGMEAPEVGQAHSEQQPRG
jgi:response regulator NasT